MSAETHAYSHVGLVRHRHVDVGSSVDLLFSETDEASLILGVLVNIGDDLNKLL